MQLSASKRNERSNSKGRRFNSKRRLRDLSVKEEVKLSWLVPNEILKF